MTDRSYQHELNRFSTMSYNQLKTRFNAEKFARNMVRMSNKLKFNDFEFITIG